MNPMMWDAEFQSLSQRVLRGRNLVKRGSKITCGTLYINFNGWGDTSDHSYYPWSETSVSALRMLQRKHWK